jgi:hypothetical protein
MTRLSELPVDEKKGFFANYAKQIGLSVTCLIITAIVVVFAHFGNAPPTLAFAAFPLLFASVICLAWPFHCYRQYRMLMSYAPAAKVGASDRRRSYIY